MPHLLAAIQTHTTEIPNKSKYINDASHRVASTPPP